MLIRLQPSQTAAFWDVLRHAYMVSQKIPKDCQGEAGVQLLSNLLSGKAESWLSYVNTEEGRQIYAVLITSITRNRVQGFNTLTIDALYGLRRVTDELAFETVNGLKVFAKVNNCKTVIAGTLSARVEELALLTGFKKTYTMLELEV